MAFQTNSVIDTKQNGLLRQLLDVIAGKAEWLRFEGMTPEFGGFEFALRKCTVTEWHQTKINAPNGNWTVNALKRETVLEGLYHYKSTRL